MKFSRALCAAVAMLVAFVPRLVWAQATGSVQGVVSDEGGAPIADATVTLRGPQLGERVRVTDANGRFVFRAVPVGEYSIQATLEGFAVVETTIRVGFDASSSVDLTLSAEDPGTIVVTSESTSKLEAGRPSWNTWFSLAGAARGEPVSELHAGKTYDFYLDIARLQWRAAGVASASVGDDLMTELRRAYDDGEVTLGLRVRPTLIGDGLEILKNSGETWVRGSWEPVADSQAPGIEVRLGNLLDANRPLPTPGTPWMEIADSERAGGTRFRVRANKRGCATLVLSILNADGRIPLDALVRHVAVGGAVCAVDPDNRELSADFVALLRGYAGGLDVAGALQLLETGTSPGLSGATVAIYVPKTPVGDCSAFTWNVGTTLSYHLFKGRSVAAMLAKAHLDGDSDGYSDLADYLRRVLFPLSRSGTKECGREQALEALRVLSSAREPKMYFTLVTQDNEPRFAPIALLFSLRAPARKGADPIPFFAAVPQIFQPLPRTRASTTPCIRHWTFLLPEEIEGGAVELPADLARHTRTKREIGDLRALIETAVRTPTAIGEEPIGLVLLAHHADGAVYFDEADQRVLASELEDAEFPPGSVALLATCSSGDLVSNLDFVQALNDAGFGTILLSPFPADVAFGEKLALVFAEAVANAPPQDGPTIDEVFSSALATAAKGVGSNGMALEFLLAGAPNVRVCRPTEDGK